MPIAPIPSSSTHTFPNGKPLGLKLAETSYLLVIVGWFFYWAFYHGFARLRDWIPLILIVIGYAILQSRLLVFYERKGDAVRISGEPEQHDR